MAAAAFLVTMVLGYPYLSYLRRAGLGKKVRIEGPSTHIEKTGTPTMGGLLVSFVVLIMTSLLSVLLFPGTGRSILLPTGVIAATSAVGWYVDRLTLVGG
jgi:phospho-N-acetylmuramoyl-pentapeptide-transferase